MVRGRSEYCRKGSGDRVDRTHLGDEKNLDILPNSSVEPLRVQRASDLARRNDGAEHVILELGAAAIRRFTQRERRRGDFLVQLGDDAHALSVHRFGTRNALHGVLPARNECLKLPLHRAQSFVRNSNLVRQLAERNGRLLLRSFRCLLRREPPRAVLLRVVELPSLNLDLAVRLPPRHLDVVDRLHGGVHGAYALPALHEQARCGAPRAARLLQRRLVRLPQLRSRLDRPLPPLLERLGALLLHPQAALDPRLLRLSLHVLLRLVEDIAPREESLEELALADRALHALKVLLVRLESLEVRSEADDRLVQRRQLARLLHGARVHRAELVVLGDGSVAQHGTLRLEEAFHVVELREGAHPVLRQKLAQVRDLNVHLEHSLLDLLA